MLLSITNQSRNQKINQLYSLLERIKPIEEDGVRVVYFCINKSTIEDYIKYNLSDNYEGYDQETIERYFNEDYPDNEYWYKMFTTSYLNYRSMSINRKGILYADMDAEGYDYKSNFYEELFDFLIYKVEEVIKKLENGTYNDYVSKNLPYKEKFGVIKRSDYWKLYPENKKDLFDDIGEEKINYFIENASEIAPGRIKSMTSRKYFEAVKLAYIAACYEVDNMTGRELYAKYADGRDEGLSKLDLDSCEEFENWYNNSDRGGAHPYEIIVGHSYSRINLYIGNDDTGYYLALDGSRILRKIEIVRIYFELSNNNIPVKIYSPEIIKNALKGEDYIGIVPKDVMPIYCEGYFNEPKPREFTRFLEDKMLDYITWQEADKIYLKEVK